MSQKLFRSANGSHYRKGINPMLKNLSKQKKNAILLVLFCIVMAALVAVLMSILMNRWLGPAAPADPTPAPVAEIKPPVQETPKRWQIEETSAEVEEGEGNLLMASIKLGHDGNTLDEKYNLIHLEDPAAPAVTEATAETTVPEIPEVQETPVVETTPEILPEAFLTEEEIIEAMGKIPEPMAISNDEYMAQILPIREENYAMYLAKLPWLETRAENLWTDNEVHENDDQNWLPGLKVSSLTEDMFTLPEWCSEETFKCIVAMLGSEAGNCEDDENVCYTGGVLYNRIFHSPWFIQKYGNEDKNISVRNNLNAIGQYNPLYTTESWYNHIVRDNPQEVVDRIVRAAYLVVNGYVDMPETVVFQAEFVQGGGVWKTVHIHNSNGYQATEYYCFTLGVHGE